MYELLTRMDKTMSFITIIILLIIYFILDKKDKEDRK